jgi:hypothetical protein
MFEKVADNAGLSWLAVRQVCFIDSNKQSGTIYDIHSFANFGRS